MTAALLLIWFFSGWFYLRLDGATTALRLHHGVTLFVPKVVAWHWEDRQPYDVVSMPSPHPEWDFEFEKAVDRAGSSVYLCSTWILAIPFALPAIWLWSTHLASLLHRAHYRRQQNLCASCGYDRRGLAALTACPECGTPPNPK